MNEKLAASAWPDSMLAGYGEMLSVSDVSQVLNLGPRNVRNLLTSLDADIRLPGVKIGKSWRISRDQLRLYLVAHHNEGSLTTVAVPEAQPQAIVSMADQR